MASFETLSIKDLNKPSYGEIRDFAIHLKVRFGDEAASTADYFIQKHEDAGDLLRANMWQAVSSSIKANDATHSSNPIRVNNLH